MTATTARPTAGPAPAATAPDSLTGVFVRLKLSLMRNGLKGSSKRKAAWIGSLVFALVVAFFATFGLALLRGNAHAGTVVVLLAAILALGWTFMPLFFPTGDETLDPSRLVMLPLRPRPLVRALLASSLIGIGPLFTLCLAVGSVIAVARGTAGAVAAVVAVPLLLLGCVTLARAVATANVRLLSSRKGRDLAVLSGLLIAVGAQVANFAGQRLFQTGGLAQLEPVEAVVRWLPPATAVGMVDSVGDGAYGVAAAQLALTLGALALLLWFWERSLTRLMVTPDGSTVAAAGPGKDRGAGGFWSLLPDGRTGAVVQRTLRYMVRDPKTKSSWVTALAIGLIVPVFNALQGTGSLYLACFGAGMLGVQMYNQFGQDTSAFWMVAQTISTPRDAYLELRARALALVLVAGPYTVLVTVVTAALLDDWEGFPAALGVAVALVGSMFCSGALASARFPYSIPTEGAFKNVSPGQGALAWLGIFGGMLVSALISAPVIALTIYLNVSQHGLAWIVLPVGAAWGALAAWAGLRLAAPMVARRLPEILLAVSKD
ncbi:transporter [Streptomyces subrutilus]|uniref:Transporter n=1 Tax=Streptomyces subrutilus TaxID=36818 RepID=A0A5P2URJ7_9ACTN|nr:transporter [Streptomyces subrutilus]QEU80124.1 transporter [Streptomyces subrutilus]WSJ30607.1 transporter [Streptomyces subrutilus]GGZ50353.1 transporter [Streptomyces subrutilus]